MNVIQWYPNCSHCNLCCAIFVDPASRHHDNRVIHGVAVYRFRREVSRRWWQGYLTDARICLDFVIAVPRIPSILGVEWHTPTAITIVVTT